LAIIVPTPEQRLLSALPVILAATPANTIGNDKSMNSTLKILIVEDDAVSALVVKRTLTRAQHQVVVVGDGLKALEYLNQESVDVLITDWMMPRMDGIELIRRVRASIKPTPALVMITALASERAHHYALEAGADAYMSKPCSSDEINSCLKRVLRQTQQPLPDCRHPNQDAALSNNCTAPPCIAVCLAASSGGPFALRELISRLPSQLPAALFVVQHAPGWMLNDLVTDLARTGPFAVELADDGVIPQPGRVYVAPANRHLGFGRDPIHMQLFDTPEENYVRPAADVLFRSAAEAFGCFSCAVVLTGIGRDGGAGAAYIAGAGGLVLVQDPETALAQAMPRTVMAMDIHAPVFPLMQLPKAIADYVSKRSQLLMQQHQQLPTE